jgi:hypothetical protein
MDDNVFDVLGVREEESSKQKKPKNEEFSGYKKTANRETGFADFMAFRKFISLSVITFLYAIGALIITGAGIVLFIRASNTRYGSEEIVWIGLGIIILGNVFWRMFCEVLILMFRIAKTLVNIEKNTKKTDISN